VTDDSTNRDHSWKISRRDVNTALLSGALAAISPKIFGDAPRAGSLSPVMEGFSSSFRLVHERHWHIGDTDECMHVLGNGRALIHEVGPNIAFFRAPWISSPNLLTMSLVRPAEIRTVSSREQGTTIWHHKLYVGADSVGEIVDFLEEGQPCLRRTISSTVELTFSVHGPRLVDYSDRYHGQVSLLGQWPYGTSIFLDFLSGDPFTVQLMLPENTRFQASERETPPKQQFSRRADSASYETRFQLSPGYSEMLIAADAGIAECLNVTERVLAKPGEQSLTKTRQSWRSRLSRIRWTGTYHSKDLPVDSVIDDVGTLLLGQQSQAGGFLGEEPLPFFYLRDQYGVSRALLALNLVDEAKAILAYYHSIWSVYGRLHNAQTDGPRHWFHRAENDDVEITGYLIIQSFDYLKATGNDEFIAQIFPMLEWALVAQENQLLGNMLPFNGDETYVERILPRTHLNDGASEATLLYLAAAERLVAWAEARKIWRSETLLQHQRTLQAVKQDYTWNFAANGTLTVNNPRRRELGSLPRFRYGVCLGQYDENCLFLATTEVAEDSRYFCYSCYPKRTRQAFDSKSYFVPSVVLTSSVIDYSAVSQEVMTKTLAQALDVFTQNGRFSWPEMMLPGFEAAVVSLALLKRRDPRTSEFIQQMLALRDPTGIWTEYYRGTKPQGGRCNSWASGLNLVALLDYAASSSV